MSPVSRGRRTKKKRTGKRPTPARKVQATALEPEPEAPERPAWFDPAIHAVLDGAEPLLSARGPRELEELTTRLLGAELHRVLSGGHSLRFDWWFEEVVRAAADRPESAAANRLLHGLASIGPVGSVVLADDPGAPEWLGDLPGVAATGEVFRMRDRYGTRFAVLAAFAYGGGRDPFVYLFDIDASGLIRLAGAGVHDDLDQAAAAWRASAGPAAEDTRPVPVEHTRELGCLVHAIGDDMIMGDESREVMDNWFRAQRRSREVFGVLGSPVDGRLFDGIDVTVMTEPFTAWYADRYRREPNAEALEELASEWMEGALPETWFSVSPGRVLFLRELIGDWRPGPVALTARDLLPDWAAWLGERDGLPEPLWERVRRALGSSVGV